MLRLVAPVFLGFLCLSNALAKADSRMDYGRVVSKCGDEHPRLEFQRTGLNSFTIGIYNSQTTPAMESALGDIVRDFDWAYSFGCHVIDERTIHIFRVYRPLEKNSKARGVFYFPTDHRVTSEYIMLRFAENRPLDLARGEGLIMAPCPEEADETCFHVRLDPFPSDSHPVTELDISGDPEFHWKHTDGRLQLRRPDDAADE